MSGELSSGSFQPTLEREVSSLLVTTRVITSSGISPAYAPRRPSEPYDSFQGNIPPLATIASAARPTSVLHRHKHIPSQHTYRTTYPSAICVRSKSPALSWVTSYFLVIRALRVPFPAPGFPKKSMRSGLACVAAEVDADAGEDGFGVGPENPGMEAWGELETPRRCAFETEVLRCSCRLCVDRPSWRAGVCIFRWDDFVE